MEELYQKEGHKADHCLAAKSVCTAAGETSPACLSEKAECEKQLSDDLQELHHHHRLTDHHEISRDLARFHHHKDLEELSYYWDHKRDVAMGVKEKKSNGAYRSHNHKNIDNRLHKHGHNYVGAAGRI